MWTQNTNGILMSGVPIEHGKPIHLEHDDDLARCDFAPDGQLTFVHTPDDEFRRVHELMHARHTVMKRVKRQYSGVYQGIFDIVEDVRMHTKFWPWADFCTPKVIQESTAAFMAAEEKEMTEALSEHPEARGTWHDFAYRIRQCAVRIGLGHSPYSAVAGAGFASHTQESLAREVIELVIRNREGKAARTLQTVFPPPPQLGGVGRTGKGDGVKVLPNNGGTKQPVMEIIELPHTVAIPEATIGYRRTTSGSRLHRPSLFKPILPDKIFLRRSPQEPGGTILVDASGSMGSWDRVKEWCEKAPFGTIAYYSGTTRNKGKLFVYARNGRRAQDIVDPHGGNNIVDGPAMDWLMSQARPRLFITDRGFCGAPDSHAQVARLEVLERSGEITVKDYSTRSE